MKLLVITEVSGISINDSLSQLVRGLSNQELEITYYNPCIPSVITDDAKSFSASISLNDLSDKIVSADYVILDSRMSTEFYQISLGMLYGRWLDRVYVFDNEQDFTELKNTLQNRKTNEPFEGESLLVNTSNYDELFYRLVTSTVDTLTFDESVLSRFETDYKLLGLIWISGTINVVAALDSPDPYFVALLNRC